MHKHAGHSELEADAQPLTDIIAVKGSDSAEQKFPPELTIKSSHIRIGETIGEGNRIQIKN